MATTKRVSETAHLSWLNGHLERAEPTLARGEHGGFYMMVPCEMGTVAHHHYLAPDPADATGDPTGSPTRQRIMWRQEPYAWPSAGAAFDAVERLRQQK